MYLTVKEAHTLFSKLTKENQESITVRSAACPSQVV